MILEGTNCVLLDTKAYLNLLFQPGEFTCFTDKATGTLVSSSPKPTDTLVCINALHAYKDLSPSQPWHSEGRPRRADANVVSYRNFVLELDNGSLEEQYAMVTSRLPISAITFSGGKSLHFIISLEQPLSTLEEYKNTASRLLALVPEADPSCRNPSRLSRLPGPVRPDSGMKQKLMHLTKRVPYETLNALLPAVATYTPRERTDEEKRRFISPLLLWASQNPDEVMREHNIKGRNAFFYYLYCRMQDVHMDQDKRAEFVATTWANLRDRSDFSLREAMAAARIRNV